MTAIQGEEATLPLFHSGAAVQVWVRISHLRQAFHQRLCEWELATILFVWGLALLVHIATLSGPAFASLRMIADESHWGVFTMIGGLMRLMALAVNGAWRPMYYARAWLSVSSLVVWILISLGFLLSGSTGTGLAVYPVLALFEVFSLLRSARDAACAETEARLTAGQQTQGLGDERPAHPA